MPDLIDVLVMIVRVISGVVDREIKIEINKYFIRILFFPSLPCSRPALLLSPHSMPFILIEEPKFPLDEFSKDRSMGRVVAEKIPPRRTRLWSVFPSVFREGRRRRQDKSRLASSHRSPSSSRQPPQ